MSMTVARMQEHITFIQATASSCGDTTASQVRSCGTTHSCFRLQHSAPVGLAHCTPPAAPATHLSFPHCGPQQATTTPHNLQGTPLSGAASGGHGAPQEGRACASQEGRVCASNKHRACAEGIEKGSQGEGAWQALVLALLEVDGGTQVRAVLHCLNKQAAHVAMLSRMLMLLCSATSSQLSPTDISATFPLLNVGVLGFVPRTADLLHDSDTRRLALQPEFHKEHNCQISTTALIGRQVVL